MSGSDLVGKLVSAPKAKGEPIESHHASDDRLVWPAAALLILLLSAGLWVGIGMLLQTLFG